MRVILVAENSESAVIREEVKQPAQGPLSVAEEVEDVLRPAAEIPTVFKPSVPADEIQEATVSH